MTDEYVSPCSDDERDLLYFMRKKPSGKSKWSVEQMPLQQIRLDAIELTLKEPVDTCVAVFSSHLPSRQLSSVFTFPKSLGIMGLCLTQTTGVHGWQSEVLKRSCSGF